MKDAHQAVSLSPNDVATLNLRGSIYLSLGRYVEAISDYENASSLDEFDLISINSLAWIYATAIDEAYRNPTKAFELASKACEYTGHQEAIYLDTLAAACAALGRFEQAAKHQQTVVSLIPHDERGEYEERLALYRLERTYVDKPRG